jgi:mannose/fructose/N-acetylgalactosamine-specific phosphotransferase system component IIC
MVLELLPLVVLGAVLGLDVVSFPQAMISRPIVAATVAGALLGEPQQGIVAGAALEFFALETLPFGASRYPEWGSAAVVGGALFATQPHFSAGSLTTSVLAALATAWVGGWSMVYLRRLNAVWARKRHDAVARGSRRVVIGLQLYGMTADLLRGALLTFVALLILVPAQRLALSAWHLDARLSRALVVTVASAVAGAAAWKVLHSTSGARWLFVGGLAIGLALLSIR